MKVATVIIVLVMLVVAVYCRPEKLDLKKIKEEGARKKACLKECSDVMAPVCAAQPGEKPKSLANECVMNNYNCEQNKQYKKISDGECPNSQGIRLS